MSRKPRVIATNGPAPAVINQWDELERIWLGIAARHPKARIGRGNPNSVAAYALRITTMMRGLRAIARKHPEQQMAIDMAIKVGYEVANAYRRFNLDPYIKTGITRRRQMRDFARRSAITRAGKQNAIRDLAIATRHAHPYDTRHSSRWLANYIGDKLDRHPETVRTALRKLGLR